LILAFGAVLMLAVLLSERARRSVLSISVLFLVAGFALGRGGLGWLHLQLGDELLQRFTQVALFAILFSDAALLPVSQLRQAWRLPGRALLFGLPLTLGTVAVAGHLLLGLSWLPAVLLGAVLSPTDPVFIAAILEREIVPLRLRRLLQVESGLNDGLALPIVTLMLALVGHRDPHPTGVLLESALGIGLGVLVPLLPLHLERRAFFAASEAYRPLGGFAIGCVLFGAASLLHANEFLAAFAGGVTAASVGPQHASSLRQLGRPLAEILKLAALLIFGAVLTLPALLRFGAAGLVFAAVALLVARPLGLVLALLGGGLPRREWLVAAWFGPKGFASLLYALTIVQAGLPDGQVLFDVSALVIVISILAHSSTDVLVARLFQEREARAADEELPRST
jgi:NhaP-type Na+/H+ or K+/H+ antiporter